MELEKNEKELKKEIKDSHDTIVTTKKNIKELEKKINKKINKYENISSERDAQQKAEDEYQDSINKCHKEHSERQCERIHWRPGKQKIDFINKWEDRYKRLKKDKDALETAQQQLTTAKGEIKQKRQQRQKLLLHKKNEKKFI